MSSPAPAEGGDEDALDNEFAESSLVEAGSSPSLVLGPKEKPKGRSVLLYFVMGVWVAYHAVVLIAVFREGATLQVVKELATSGVFASMTTAAAVVIGFYFGQDKD